VETFRLALAQINSTVGDFTGNGRRLVQGMQRAEALGADLVAFPELAITGYPPEDLLLKPSFLAANRSLLESVAAQCGNTVTVVGYVEHSSDVYNAAALLHNGKLVGGFRKHLLPDYGVFDEERYFVAGSRNRVFVVAGIRIGISICEDIWHAHGPAEGQVGAGADLVVSINASPYHIGKQAERERMIAKRATDHQAWVAYVNCVGGQDELVFDGGSFLCDPGGKVVARAKQFEEDLLVIDIDLSTAREKQTHTRADEPVEVVEIATKPAHIEKPEIEPKIEEPLGRLAEIYKALVTGTRDYVVKNGFQKVIIGLSGGIDSSLTACVAADAVGAEKVLGLILPSRFSSTGSVTDARGLAENLGANHRELSIDDAYASVVRALGEGFDAGMPQQPEENIQARLRAVFWMALSNKLGALVLVTSNKSEVATGYTTLYGDMAGGFSPLKDVYKTLVYELARYRNEAGKRPVIPEGVFTKAPSAELRPNQRDQDTLPPYDLLDQILNLYIEDDLDLEDIVAKGFDADVVKLVLGMVDRSEFKRRQGAVGVKITQRAFGRDRRMPITNLFPKNRPSN
jgi:NAD+ synthase (glutamine-hydrolysing)